MVLLFPLFLHSVSARTVDGHTVTFAWWYDDPQDYVQFDSQIVSSSDLDFITIQADITLSSPMKAKTIWNFEANLSSINLNSIDVLSFKPLNVDKVALDDLSPAVDSGLLIVSGLQYREDVYYIRIQFKINSPSWTIAPVEGTMTIDGKSYNYQKSTTWAEWCDSSYNTLGLYVDEGKIYYGDNYKLVRGDTSVDATSFISENGVYTLEELETVTTTIDFYIRFCKSTPGSTYKQGTFQADYNMTWGDWINSDYNIIGLIDNNGYVFDSNGNYPLTTVGNVTYQVTDIIDQSGTNYYLWYSYNITYGLVNYMYDFDITSITVVEEDEKGLLTTVLDWLRSIRDNILAIPQAIGNKIYNLFIPDQEDIISTKDKFISLLESRFGLAYDAVEVVDNYASAFVYTETKASIDVPEVTVDLVGVPYSVGGWTVDLIPDGFEDVVEVLKLINNIVCTGLFVNAVRKRFGEVIGDAR